MNTIALYITLHGLIALVPAADGTNQMSALLVDSTVPSGLPSGFSQCLVKHTPMLTVRTSDSECSNANCSLPGRTCTCILANQDISLDIKTALPPKVATLSKHVLHDIPFNAEAAADFSYLANLASLNLKLDQRFVNDSIPPQHLVARMKFPFDSVAACSLGTRREEGADNVYPMGFRVAATEEDGTVNEQSQALAQMAFATLKVPDDGTGNPEITLVLSDFGGGNEHRMKLLSGPFGIEITLANHRPTFSVPDEPCDDGIARDFGFFYDLLENPPSWEQRPVPHIKHTHWKSALDLAAPECPGNNKTLLSRPICPMASFNPESR